MQLLVEEDCVSGVPFPDKQSKRESGGEREARDEETLLY
jgi:hypothetical protein